MVHNTVLTADCGGADCGGLLYKFSLSHFSGDEPNPNYGRATIGFVVIPFILILTLGKGYQELLEAATMEKFKQKVREYIKREYPELSEERIEKELENNTPGLIKRIWNTLQTFITFVPGLSWIPIPKEVAHAIGDDSYSQTLLRRKLYELFGENAPQFILQLSIELHKKAKDEILSYTTLLEVLTKSPNSLAIATSLIGIILRSTDVYLGLCSKDKYGTRTEPYSCFKNKMIVIPIMTIAVLPRVLTYSTFLASSFPLFGVKNDDPLGMRFGLIVLMSVSMIYAIGLMTFGYLKIVKKKLLDWSDFILAGFSNLISPCLIQHQTSRTIVYSSGLAIAYYAILLTTLSISINIDTKPPSENQNVTLLWNASYDPGIFSSPIIIKT